MKIKYTMPALVLLSSCLAAGNALAASVTGGLIYQKTETFNGSIQFADSFTIDKKGTYQATLTDLKSVNAFTSSSLDIVRKTDSLGKLTGPGSITFQAGPGDHNVNLFAMVAPVQISADEKQRLMDEEKKRRGKIWWHSLTKEQQLAKKQAKRELWKSLSEEGRAAYREKYRRITERQVDALLAATNTGTYDIEISHVQDNGVSAVPLPAAVWLFGSGMLALVGLGRRKARR